MKRLLTLLPVALIPLVVYSCGGFHTKPTEVVKGAVEQLDPNAAERLKEGFDAIPRIIPLTKPELAPVLPSYKPKATKRVPAARAPGHPQPPGPLPRSRPPVHQAPVVESADTLPPQQGVICIFPLNMIPHCKPEPSGRMP